jgi:hypothetical protein
LRTWRRLSLVGGLTAILTADLSTPGEP